jgi:tetratricopeptide (TPR) repeat protein
MAELEGKYSWFEQELRENVDDSDVDYVAIESNVFAHIQTSERELGELSILLLENIPSEELFDRVEKDLSQRISQHTEYDEPVNDCISSEEELNSSQWRRLGSKLEERILQVSSLPQWEQILMAPAEEISVGKWEELEEKLFTEISSLEKTENWELVEIQDEIQIPGDAEKTEEKIERAWKVKSECWEQVLKTDEVFPYSRWEKIEENLFCRIKNDKRSSEIAKQPFWYILDNYFTVLKRVGVVTIPLVLAAIGITGLVLNNRTEKTVPTFVYQVQGKAVEIKSLENSKNEYTSVAGGTVSIINSHGLVELQNGSDVQIMSMSKKKAAYRVSLGNNRSSGINQGRVSFLVNPHSPKQSFRVYTPDYELVVKGTYFRVEPDLGGKFSTRVLEGAVKVVSKNFKDTLIRAGQCITYDFAANQYKIQDGGPVIQRKEIESVPDADELAGYKMLSIRSEQPDADIRIDGRYYGSAPLIISQPQGSHRVIISKEGFISVDTLIEITGGNTKFSLEVALNKMQAPKVTKSVVQQKSQSTVKKQEIIYPELVAEKLLGDQGAQTDQKSEAVYNDAQKAEQKGNWKKAISFYQQVFDNQNAPKLRREDALFSIGRLKAENEVNEAGARDVFLTYLAMYPGGSYAGESWLRLAELEFRNNPENAIQYYLKYFEMFPRHPRISELQNRVGVIYLQQGKYDQAILMFRQALSTILSNESGEKRNILINLHRALKAKGDDENAAAIWQEYLAEKAQNSR